jgi:hypothetical protein
MPIGGTGPWGRLAQRFSMQILLTFWRIPGRKSVFASVSNGVMVWTWGGGWSGDDPLSAVLAVLVLVLLVALALLALGHLPLLATEMLASFLAEVVLEFVIGAVIARRVLKPRSLDDYWAVMLRKTWLAGLALVIAAGFTGWLLQTLQPDAATLFQVFR